jgi:AraC-like DNA-binding protein
MKGGVKQRLVEITTSPEESGVTLLPSDAEAVDGTLATQVLLVRSYLERQRRRPRSHRSSPARSLPDAPASSRAPTAVRSAIAFIDAHAAEPIGLAEVAAAAQLSPRALQAAFRRHLGTTPLNHLRAVRMARIHADLQAARPGDGQTVSAVANRWGFSQLSRFAHAYKRRYGVSPRQTLSRSTP